MIPANLSVVGGGIHPQCHLSLQHVDRVLAAISPGCCVDDVMSCVCYVTHPYYIAIAKEEWNKVCKVSRYSCFVGVFDALNKGPVCA